MNIAVDGNFLFLGLSMLLVNTIQHDALKDCFIRSLQEFMLYFVVSQYFKDTQVRRAVSGFYIRRG
jgi:hypothetical protein